MIGVTLNMGHIWISYEAQEDWYGSANVEVTMTYENSLSDTVNFVLTTNIVFVLYQNF